MESASKNIKTEPFQQIFNKNIQNQGLKWAEDLYLLLSLLAYFLFQNTFLAKVFSEE